MKTQIDDASREQKAFIYECNAMASTTNNKGKTRSKLNIGQSALMTLSICIKPCSVHCPRKKFQPLTYFLSSQLP